MYIYEKQYTMVKQSYKKENKCEPRKNVTRSEQKYTDKQENYTVQY